MELSEAAYISEATTAHKANMLQGIETMLHARVDKGPFCIPLDNGSEVTGVALLESGEPFSGYTTYVLMDGQIGYWGITFWVSDPGHNPPRTRNGPEHSARLSAKLELAALRGESITTELFASGTHGMCIKLGNDTYTDRDHSDMIVGRVEAVTVNNALSNSLVAAETIRSGSAFKDEAQIIRELVQRLEGNPS